MAIPLYRITVVRTDASIGYMEIYSNSEAEAKAVISDHFPYTILDAEVVPS